MQNQSLTREQFKKIVAPIVKQILKEESADLIKEAITEVLIEEGLLGKIVGQIMEAMAPQRRQATPQPRPQQKRQSSPMPLVERDYTYDNEYGEMEQKLTLRERQQQAMMASDEEEDVVESWDDEEEAQPNQRMLSEQAPRSSSPSNKKADPLAIYAEVHGSGPGVNLANLEQFIGGADRWKKNLGTK